MDQQDFMFILFSSFRICDIDKVYHESLELFLNDITLNPSFKEKFGDINAEAAIKDISVLASLGIITQKKKFKRKYYAINLSDKSAVRMLSLCPRENVIEILSLALKYKQLASMWDEIEKISYEEKYSVITREFTEKYMTDSIKLINEKRGN